MIVTAPIDGVDGTIPGAPERVDIPSMEWHQKLDEELDRVRQLDTDRIQRPALMMLFLFQLFAGIQLARAYGPETSLVVGTAAISLILSAHLTGHVVARSANPTRWFTAQRYWASSVVALVLGVTGGTSSPIFPMFALAVVITAARLKGRAVFLSLAFLVTTTSLGCLLANPAPTGLGYIYFFEWIIAAVGITRITTSLVTTERDARGSAFTDPLTGLLNRAAFEAQLSEFESDLVGRGEWISIVACDLDGFKKVNDTFGHAAGDQALAKASAAMRTSLRTGEFIYRLGGDEFAVILPDCDERAAGEIAERMRLAVIDWLRFEHPLTLSVGIASHGGARLDGAALLESADQALYAAKAAGRNQVRFASETAPQAPTPAERRRFGGALKVS